MAAALECALVFCQPPAIACGGHPHIPRRLGRIHPGLHLGPEPGGGLQLVRGGAFIALRGVGRGLPLRLQAAWLGPLPHQGLEVLPRGGLQHGPGHGVARVGIRKLPGANHGRQRQQPAGQHAAPRCIGGGVGEGQGGHKVGKLCKLGRVIEGGQAAAVVQQLRQGGVGVGRVLLCGGFGQQVGGAAVPAQLALLHPVGHQGGGHGFGQGCELEGFVARHGIALQAGLPGRTQVELVGAVVLAAKHGAHQAHTYGGLGAFAQGLVFQQQPGVAQLVAFGAATGAQQGEGCEGQRRGKGAAAGEVRGCAGGHAGAFSESEEAADSENGALKIP